MPKKNFQMNPWILFSINHERNFAVSLGVLKRSREYLEDFLRKSLIFLKEYIGIFANKTTKITYLRITWMNFQKILEEMSKNTH